MNKLVISKKVLIVYNICKSERENSDFRSNAFSLYFQTDDLNSFQEEERIVVSRDFFDFLYSLYDITDLSVNYGIIKFNSFEEVDGAFEYIENLWKEINDNS